MKKPFIFLLILGVVVALIIWKKRNTYTPDPAAGAILGGLKNVPDASDVANPWGGTFMS